MHINYKVLNFAAAHAMHRETTETLASHFDEIIAGVYNRKYQRLPVLKDANTTWPEVSRYFYAFQLLDNYYSSL